MSKPAKDQESSGYLWVEQGTTKVGPVADVAPVSRIDRHYTYAIPESLTETLQTGHRVRIPFRKKGNLTEGFVLKIYEAEWTSTLHHVDSLVDSKSYLNEELLELGQWISKHYFCPLGNTLKALVPESVRVQRGFRTVRYIHQVMSHEEIEEQTKRLGDKQRAVLEYLQQAQGATRHADLCEETGSSDSTLRTMAKRGWIRIDSVKEPPEAPDFDQLIIEPTYDLNDDQKEALSRVEATLAKDAFKVMLLHGVSGSGKTEIYIQAMRQMLEAGRQAIMLVPEIALTTQLVDRLACRFEDVAIIHSGLSGVERSLTWQAIADGKKKVVIGTRSAVFAPCPNLGLIVIDEEQEPSYKNLRAPRFHVRDVGIVRAQKAGIPILLGSATPSLESWHNSRVREHFECISLPNRVKNLPMPTVHVIDMQEQKEITGWEGVFSQAMEGKLSEVFERGEQAVLLINRRGFARSIYCPACHYRFECPNCETPLVFHSVGGQDGSIRCHFCSHRMVEPKVCPDPSCRRPLRSWGAGTQRAEEILQQRFPSIRICRADSDTMVSKQKYQQLIDDVMERRVDLVVGTQMIAKGLDFPAVSFVGVLNAESMLGGGDFRGSERLFQLITQVAGRAGRHDKPGEVVVQSAITSLPAVERAILHDFPGFAEGELEVRRRTGYPPWYRLTRITLGDANSAKVREEADKLRKALDEQKGEQVDILGPVPGVPARLRGKYQYELVIRALDASRMQTFLGEARTGKWIRAAVQSLVVDVDPV